MKGYWWSSKKREKMQDRSIQKVLNYIQKKIDNPKLSKETKKSYEQEFKRITKIRNERRTGIRI